ncbi:hypothetical protein LDENG_00086720 [Lucifuga dentata]|nr:hypothetical protein LDENG_00086720 [Lucifuga dentata]
MHLQLPDLIIVCPSGLPNCASRSLQFVQNAAARILTETRKFDHITPILASLYWLPVQAGADFMVLFLTYKLTKKSIGFRALTYSVPYLWNGLPLHVKEASSAEIFKSRLKAHLYSLHNSLNITFQTSF